MLIDDVKLALRISSAAFDAELQDLIYAAERDLDISGTDVVLETDPLVKQAIILYCKANFGLDNKDSEKYQKAYESAAMKLSLSLSYKDVT